MLMHEPAHFIKFFVTDLDAALGKLKPNANRRLRYITELLDYFPRISDAKNLKT